MLACGSCRTLFAAAVLGATITSPVAACDAPGSSQPVQLFMADGQLISRPISLFVNRNISTDTSPPTLTLYGGHAVTSPMAGDDRATPAKDWFPDQSWSTTVDGTTVTLCGTWIIIYLNRPDFIEWYKPMRSFAPALNWDGGKAVLSSRVNIGNAPAAWAWAVAMAAVLGLVILSMAYPLRRMLRAAWAARRVNRPPTDSLSPEAKREAARESPFCLMCADDGHLSLSKVQIALWTSFIGLVVFFYGLIQHDVPTIPIELLVLMGLSVATGGISYLAPSPQVAPITGVEPISVGDRVIRPKLSDLIHNFPNPGPSQLSISRAQMLFWTVLTAVLFISKSALEGGLWEVPWTLVGLMGISQAGYLVPKYYGPSAGTLNT